MLDHAGLLPLLQAGGLNVPAEVVKRKAADNLGNRKTSQGGVAEQVRGALALDILRRAPQVRGVHVRLRDEQVSVRWAGVEHGLGRAEDLRAALQLVAVHEGGSFDAIRSPGAVWSVILCGSSPAKGASETSRAMPG